jgi:hypothetical protein
MAITVTDPKDIARIAQALRFRINRWPNARLEELAEYDRLKREWEEEVILLQAEGALP